MATMLSLAALTVACAAFFSTTANAQTQTICANNDINDCYALSRSGVSPKNLCVFLDGECKVDPCIMFTTMDDCMSNTRCLFLDFAVTKCNTFQRVCSQMTTDGCNKNPLCSMTGENCMWSVPASYSAAHALPSTCPGFPVWSIGLIFTWVCMVVVLIFILLLIFKKPQRTEIEKASVEVEGVGFKDNFQPNDLDEPLST